MKLNAQEQKLHARAMGLGRQHRRVEFEVVAVVQEIAKTKLNEKFEKTLFEYIVEEMGFTEPVTYTLNSVAKNALKFHELQKALESGSLCVSKASRIVSLLKAENAAELVNFAIHHTYVEINREVARRNPKKATRDKVKFLSETEVQVTTCMLISEYNDLLRAKSLAAQKNQSGNLGKVIGATVKTHLKVHDPVRKAERWAARKARAKPQPKPEKTFCGHRTPLTAAEKHAVNLRDQGRCTHIDVKGQRCSRDRWLHAHHIQPVSQGGTNDPANLTTLCSFHHDLVHQLSLPIEDGWWNSSDAEQVRRN